jgi:pimeloyl-ACP methyl ester carboxylesterase
MTNPAIVSRIIHDGAYHPPLLVGDGPWWERLPETFPMRPERFDLEWRDRAQVGASAAGDVVLRTLGACLVGSLALPLGYHPGQIKRALADRDFYGELADSGDPKRFFRDPPGGVRVETRRAGLTRFRPKDGRCLDLSFQSPFEPVNPHERRAYLRHKKNRTAHLRYWAHRDGPRPTILAIHGFSADLYLLNEWFFALPWLYRLGYDVALFTMPFHGARQTRYSAFSGHGFFAGGVSRINEAFGQAVLDFRVFVDHLVRERGVPRVGVTGVSLGGFTSALLAATEPRLEFAIPNVPLASVPDLVLEWQPIGVVLRSALKVIGQSLVDARRMLAVTSPLTYKPLLPRERLMVIGGVGDRLAPPKHSRLLAEHWNHCQLYWFPGSHLVHFDRGEYLRHTARFLRSIGFSHEA